MVARRAAAVALKGLHGEHDVVARGENWEVWAAGCECMSILLVYVKKPAAARRTGEMCHMTWKKVHSREFILQEAAFPLWIHLQFFFTLLVFVNSSGRQKEPNFSLTPRPADTAGMSLWSGGFSRIHSWIQLCQWGAQSNGLHAWIRLHLFHHGKSILSASRVEGGGLWSVQHDRLLSFYQLTCHLAWWSDWNTFTALLIIPNFSWYASCVLINMIHPYLTL